ncbi:Dynein_light chain [Hexamita inflata]|uniref:Dynein light chain n=1 Tax=Hexamita inflata TaxID=28002 RepID=A0AA86PF32_9EUKA|nr:Dynein light chain [Hexamita inflata]
MSDIEATVDRISKHPGVIGIMVLLSDGTVLRSTFNNEETTKYSKILLPFAQLSISSIRDVDPTNELTFQKIQSDKREIIIIPSESYYVIAFTENSQQQ